MASSVSVITPSIPPRGHLLARALQSVCDQTLMPHALHVTIDHDRVGAAANRDRALSHVATELVAPLDDDDELLPDHLLLLTDVIEQSGADLVYPWFEVVGGSDPFPQYEGVAWDDETLHQVPVTWLARTEAIRAVGGFSVGWDASQGEDPGVDADGNRAGEDYRLVLRLVAAGFRIVHLDARTWRWHHHASNTSGLPSRW